MQAHLQALETEFRRLGIRHFAPREFLTLGGSNAHGRCAGKNALPPLELLPKLAAVARVWDEIRERSGSPCVITSAYRSPAYNACIKGEANSFHLRGMAADGYGLKITVADLVAVARKIRSEGFWKGGIGFYPRDGFIHVDVRGVNANW